MKKGLEETDDSYAYDVICWNCGSWNCFAIPFGQTVDDFLDKNMCKTCECHTRLK